MKHITPQRGSVIRGASGGLVVKVSSSQARYHELEPLSGQDHFSSFDTSTGWFQETDSKVIKISSENLLRN
jgi:hypothetical protein